MLRRSFLTLLGGAVAAWPLAARAQQRERTRRIGGTENDAGDAIQPGCLPGRAYQPSSAGLKGRNLHLEFRFGAGDRGRIRAHAAELVRHAPACWCYPEASTMLPTFNGRISG
jgi:putative ABC transport system substrate-binding protein